ncbi:hypothetical protein FH972_006773 [Carpinus fangiana]|jgi:hypothetical protein|uniref:Uncharacterized protein n=1 Tax=Carpinus fangiana TaxID=176857 RepID=A0A5N6QWV3_9ROSI|nr:hypothetical protein FH972_006773 [Carpinus fangiana]
MGGNRQKKSLFSVFNVFKPRRPRGGEDSWPDQDSVRKVFPSDYDNISFGCVADRKVDTKAGEFIKRVHNKNYAMESELSQSHVMASELSHGQRQTVTVYPL